VTIARRAALAGLTLAAISCGGSSNPAAPTPPVQTTTITIATAGVSPKNIEVSLGARVRFVNNDTRAHDMSSDPHPDHTDCPEINQVGFLQPGQSRETGNLVQARTCGFHDHLSPSNQALTGSITIR
jgi:plastocyanin